MKKLFKNLLSSDSWGKHFSETVRRIGKNNAGFSLVELIVVIAIMAILAAVAVIGVSVYIPKTQKAADEQMIADIQKAINLYTSGETLTPGQSGYVVVRKAGGVAVGGSLDAAPKQLITNALKATFGDNYSNELKVAYGEWTGTLAGENASNIAGSSYVKNPEALLGDVQKLTGAVSGLVGNSNVTDMIDSIEGIENYVDRNTATADQVGNAMALVVAQQAQGVNSTEFIEAWNTTGYDYTNTLNEFTTVFANVSGVSVSAYAATYAKLESMIDYVGCPGLSNWFRLREINGPADIQNCYNMLPAILNDHDTYATMRYDSTGIFETEGNFKNDTVNTLCSAGCNHKDASSFNAYFNSQSTMDAKAYLAVMGQVNDLSQDKKDEIINNVTGDAYTNDDMVDYVNGYTNASSAFSESGAVDGDIAIIVSVNSQGVITYQVYPINY